MATLKNEPTVEGDDADDLRSESESRDGHDEQAIGHKAHQEEERKALAGRSNNKAVAYLRMAVYVVVLLTAVVVCVFVYLFAKNDEEMSFEDNFSAYADKLVESFNNEVEVRIGAINSLSTAITAFAVSSGATFPNVTNPSFEMLATNARVQAGGVVIMFYNLVTDETRDGWEAYANTSRHWIGPAFQSETKARAEQDARFGIGQELEDGAQQSQQPAAGSPGAMMNMMAKMNFYSYSIFGPKGPEPEGSGPYVVAWQMSPTLPAAPVVNMNLLSVPATRATMLAAIKSEKMVLGLASDLNDKVAGNATGSALHNMFLSLGQFRHQSYEYQGDPNSAIIYPVFDSFGANRSLAGLLNVPVLWRLTFANLLPETAVGVTIVVRNTNNQTFTYRVDGPMVTYLGLGDLHDNKYDSMVVSQDVTKQIQSIASPENQPYDAPGLDDEFNRYFIDVYPSQDTEDEYVTSKPGIFAVVVASIFLFTSLVFIAYDILVARRQKIVMETAVQTGAVISSLYPKQVRDRLFEEEEEEEADKKWYNNNMNISSNDNMERSKRAIAEYYEASSILFADLAGFTKWSATKRPDDVFLLLETLYQAFDKIAFRRKVFKVETIGDCYVAVTGVPEAQDEHAVIMCKFARDCMLKMNVLTSSLTAQLGEETATLGFRVGIHSGPITGGILRGDKGRFQLFGDTINTASRMESNGIKGRIHVSEETALELRRHGCAHWLAQREDRIVAKGKGELVTYFVNMTDAKTSSATRSRRESLRSSTISSDDLDVSYANTTVEKTSIATIPRRESTRSSDDLDVSC